jgi:hypothetical protein
MIRRSLLTAALIFAGSVAVAPKVNAQSIDVPFTGSVGGACNVGQVTPGVLGTYSYNLEENPNAFSTYSSGGTPGQVSVSCNQDAEVSVSAPVQTGGPQFTPIFFFVDVYSSFGSSFIDNNGSGIAHIISAGSGTQLEINMDIDKGVALVPGVYDFVTTVNITPL